MNNELSAILKELLTYFGGMDYRNWLYENRDLLGADDCFWIITCLPISLEEKLEYLKRIKPLLVNGTHDFKRYYTTIKAYELGVEMLYEEGPDILFQITERERDNYKGMEYYDDSTFPCKSFAKFKEYYKTEFDDDEDYETMTFDSFWCIIERYRLIDGKYLCEAEYVVNGNMKAIAVSFPQGEMTANLLSREDHRYYSTDMGHLYLPMPYKEGDILTVDCRPYHKPHYAVVIYRHDNIHDCCTPGCLHYDEGYCYGNYRGRELSCHSIKHYYCGNDELSPLINVTLYEGELPEDDKLIGQVSKYIKTHEGSAAVIDEMHTRLEDFEEGLTRLVENNITLEEMKRVLSEAGDRYGIKL